MFEFCSGLGKRRRRRKGKDQSVSNDEQLLDSHLSTNLLFIRNGWVLLLCTFFSLPRVYSQAVYETPAVNVGTGLVYLLLVIFIVTSFFTPVLKFIYVIYILKYVEQTTAFITKWQNKISERISDAGRKVSENMRA